MAKWPRQHPGTPPPGASGLYVGSVTGFEDAGAVVLVRVDHLGGAHVYRARRLAGPTTDDGIGGHHHDWPALVAGDAVLVGLVEAATDRDRVVVLGRYA